MKITFIGERGCRMKSKRLRFVSILICILITIPNVGFGQAVEVKDINNHWAKNQINDWLDKQVVTGYTDGTFRPNNYIKRAEFITMINKAFNFSESSDINFSDVKETDWFYFEIGKAIKEGYISGYEDNTIRPNKYISRQEVAIILTKILKLDTSSELDGLNTFKDAENILDWSKKEVNVVIKNGYMNGYPDGTFMPTKPMTRAEAIVVLHQAKNTHKVVTLDKKGTYTLGILDGNIIITDDNITLKDTIVKGDMEISESVGEGNVYLENVTVEGTTTIKGGGENSIEVMDCKLFKVIVDKENGRIRVVAKGNTEIGRTILKSGAKLEESEIKKEGFNDIEIRDLVPEDAEINVSGDFHKVKLSSKGIKFKLRSGTIDHMAIMESGQNSVITLSTGTKVVTMIIEAKVDVIGQGKIEKGIIRANDAWIERKPDTVEGGSNSSSSNHSHKNDSSSEDHSKKIIAQVKEKLKLTIQDPKGKKDTPKIILPSTDIDGYGTKITWKTDNSEYISINDNEAIIHRRGNNNETHGEDDDSEDENILMSLLSTDNHSENDGKMTIVHLMATIENDDKTDTKTFIVNIPWGWGREITIDEDDKDDGTHESKPPVAKDVSDQELWVNQYPLTLTAEELATDGKFVKKAVYETVYDAVYGEVEAIDLTILKDGRLKISPIHKGKATVTASVYNESGGVDIKFDVSVKLPKAVTDKEAVEEARAKLKLTLFSTGHGPDQINKITLPDTDVLGYKTEITWDTDNSEFVTIDDEEAIIYRRGKNGEDHESTSVMSLSEVSIQHIEDDGGHDEESGNSDHSGKSTIVDLIATIKKGDKTDTTKTFKVNIPWGWGRKITISEN